MPDDPNTPDTTDEGNARQLREAYEASQSSNGVLARENAMLRAGVDLDSPLGKMFARAYDGELDTDAVRAAATEVGAMRAATPAAEVTLEPGEEGSTDLRQELGTGGTPPGGGEGPHPTVKMADAAKEVLVKTGNHGRALAAGFGELVGAAAEGDRRIILDVFGE